jgi:uncharacterized SAM-binding protein YcdF (DUF218 family)
MRAREHRAQAARPADEASAFFRRLIMSAALLLSAIFLLVLCAGFVVEGIQQPLERSDAIIVISGDEDQARLHEGLRLWREAWAPLLILSGAAREGPVSNAAAMRRLALDQGVPASSILLDEQSPDTYGNAVHTRRLMELHGLQSAILVTSPYHLQRAAITFRSVYRGSGVRLIANAAPDSDWRKQSWWLRKDLRRLTMTELEKLGYIAITGKFH